MPEPIHSGHFMTSNPHMEKVEDEDEDVEVDVVDVDDNENEPEPPVISKTSLQESRSKVFRIKNDENPVTFYKFGPQKQQSIAIDVSLNKLTKCIKIAYMKMTTPKWKDFKGLKLQWKHRIRLNNVIWRAYYMEFRKPGKKKKTPYCYFAVPDEDTTHQKIEGAVLEGMYWKRRMEAVCAQYKRWRTYNRPHKKRSCCPKTENTCECTSNEPLSRPNKSQTPNVIYNTSNDYIDDEFENEFTNELFNSLGTPFLFPNPREMASSGNADIMQPGLFALQPSIEEIMNVDMLEPTISINSNPPPQQRPHAPPPHYGMNQFQPISGMSSPLEPESSKEYTPKDYEAANLLLDYSQQQPSQVQTQPTRMSSAMPMGIMDAHMNQPLYSQAVYENKPTSSAASSLLDSPVPSVVVPEKVNRPAPQFNSPQPFATNLDYVPQFLASAAMSMGQNTIHTTNPTFSVINGNGGQQGLRGFMVEQPQNQLISAQPWWVQNQIQSQQNMLLNLNQPSPSPSTSSQFSRIQPNSLTQMTPIKPDHTVLSAGQPSHQVFSSAIPTVIAPRPPTQPAASQPRVPVRQVQPPSRSDLAHYLPQNETAAPSASLASMLSSRPRPEQKFAATRIQATLQPDLGNPIESKPSIFSAKPTQPAPSKESFINDFENLASSAIGLKKRFNGRISLNDVLSEQTTSAESSPAPARRNAPRAATAKAQSKGKGLSQPASVQSFATDSVLSPRDSTPPTDSVASDEGSDCKSPTAKPSRKRRYHGSCSEAADSTLNPEERKRLLHLNAEKNRREALKDGFDALVNAIPAIDEAGIKVTNAVVLNRAAQHIRNLQNRADECEKLIDEAEKRNEMLQKKVVLVQSAMPSTMTQASSSNETDMNGQIMQFFERYVKEKSKENHAFFVMSMMLKSVVEDFAHKVDISTEKDRLRRSVQKWAEEDCKVGTLRPLASHALIKIATETHLMNASGGQPSSLSDYIAKEVAQLGNYPDNF